MLISRLKQYFGLTSDVDSITSEPVSETYEEQCKMLKLKLETIEFYQTILTRSL